MRTTVDIADAKYRKLKAKAASEGKTIKQLVDEGVDRVLDGSQPVRFRKLKGPVVNSMKPNSIDLNNEKIYDLIGFP